MSDIDYEHLNVLLNKLSKEIGHNRICIIPYHVSECAYIGVYGEDGKMHRQTNGFDLRDCVQKLKTINATNEK